MGGADKVFCTPTGRLEPVRWSSSTAQWASIVVSRSGMTQMGHAVAQQPGLCAIGRATNRRFVCYAGAHRLVLTRAGLVPSCDGRPACTAIECL